jgi:hypothetical protein
MKPLETRQLQARDTSALAGTLEQQRSSEGLTKAAWNCAASKQLHQAHVTDTETKGSQKENAIRKASGRSILDRDTHAGGAEILQDITIEGRCRWDAIVVTGRT